VRGQMHGTVRAPTKLAVRKNDEHILVEWAT
jgi:hypothetical protein